MKDWILQIGFILSLVPFVMAQEPPPPPPPLIYSAPESKELKEFSDQEAGFSVTFPGIPKKEREVGENVTTVVYTVTRKGSNSSVGVLTFPINMEGRAKELIDSYRADLSKLTRQSPIGGPPKTSKVIFDREFKGPNFAGREFGYESDFYFTHVLVFVVGNRLFEVKSDVTNWHILKNHHPEIVKQFEGEGARFIKSFSLTK